jgi:hypothetical protein
MYDMILVNQKFIYKKAVSNRAFVQSFAQLESEDRKQLQEEYSSGAPAGNRARAAAAEGNEKINRRRICFK